MAFSLVQTKRSNNSATGSATATFSPSATAGNLLIAAGYTDVGTDSMSISGWTKIDYVPGGTLHEAVWYTIATGGETAITVTGGNSTTRLQTYEYSGNANPAVLEAYSKIYNNVASTSGTSNPVTTSTADALLFIATAAGNNQTTVSYSSPFTLQNNDVTNIRLITGDSVATGIGSYQATVNTGSTNTRMLLAAFSAAVTGPAIVQTVQGNGGAYTNSYTFSITPTAGNSLILSMAYGAADTITISDNKGNTWTQDKQQILTSQRQAVVWRASNVASGATTVTVQANAGQFPDSAYICDEWSGLANSSQPDTTIGANTSSGTTYAAGTINTTQTDEVLIGAIASDSNTPAYTGDASWTGLTTQAGFDLYTSVARQYRLVSSTGGYTWTLTNGSARQASQSVVAYKSSTSVGSTISSPTTLLMGI